MQISTLIKRNLIHYWRTNLAVVLGVGSAVAVLAGALLVGDSVRGSLRDLFLDRLGRTADVISATGFFRERLADDISSNANFSQRFDALCPLIVLEAVVAHDKSRNRASHVQVYGVDVSFWRFHGRDRAPADLGDRDILVGEGLARELGCAAEEDLLIRVEKPSAIPAESLHGRKEDVGRTIRLTIRGVLPASALGEFSIRPQQGAVRAVFVSLKRLQKDLEQPGKVNTILVSERPGNPPPTQLLEAALRETFMLEDLGIKLRTLDKQNCLSFENESGLIGNNLAEISQATAIDLGIRPSSIFTYLANSIRARGREVPYSLVTAMDDRTLRAIQPGSASQMSSASPIVLNDWAARDLGVREGDQIELEYYVWLPEGRLATRRAMFQLAGETPITGVAADRDLAPDYPGITATESFADWDPPFPIDLNRVRPQDEKYWHDYRTTPKAFIRLAKGQDLWQSRFGRLTSIRLFPAENSDLRGTLEAYSKSLKGRLDPMQQGLSVHPVRTQGLEASRGATDFGEYFAYFSFFLVVSALLLTALFFRLGVEQRSREIGLLEAIGFPGALIRRLFIREGMILAAAGGVIGVVGALIYGWLMMFGLRTWWVDAVGTTMLTLHVSTISLGFGFSGGIVTAIGCIVLTLRGLKTVSPRSLLAGSVEKKKEKKFEIRNSKFEVVFLAAIAFASLGILLLVLAGGKIIGQVAGFFGAGTSLLIALLCLQSRWLRRGRSGIIRRTGWQPVSKLGLRNATTRPGRSVLCIALIASATFVIVAVDAFRRESPGSLTDKRSGAGGFPLMAESLLPIAHDPNSEPGRDALNLTADSNPSLGNAHIERFRVRSGDDASCLNLYQPASPTIMAPTADFVASGRFSFQESLALTDEERNNPWLLLNRELEGGVIPAIADANSMTYVLHLKLGDEFVLNTNGGQSRLRLVAALSDSIFQSELLIPEKSFLRLFPDEEGYRFFLIDAEPAIVSDVARSLEERLSDFGFDVTSTSERLASFHRVENTYLSTFQALGGLGLILGTIGLGAVLLRNALERRKELALLRAVGYKPSHFRLMVLAENGLLLMCGLLTGTVCALLAIAPAFTSRGGHLPAGDLVWLLVAVMISGFLASLAATRAALRSPLLSALRSE